MALYLSKVQSIQSFSSKCSNQKRGEVREKEVSREEHDLDVGPMAVLSKGMRKDKKAVSFLDIWTKYNLSKYSS